VSARTWEACQRCDPNRPSSADWSDITYPPPSNFGLKCDRAYRTEVGNHIFLSTIDDHPLPTSSRAHFPWTPISQMPIDKPRILAYVVHEQGRLRPQAGCVGWNRVSQRHEQSPSLLMFFECVGSQRTWNFIPMVGVKLQGDPIENKKLKLDPDFLHITPKLRLQKCN
jgi:hypothetical protein